MKRTITFILFMCCYLSVPVLAQEPGSLPGNGEEGEMSYTYISECKYNVIHEIDGKVFVPAAHQFRQGTIQPIKTPGDMLVTVKKSSIVVEGAEGLGRYNIVSKRPDKVGYVYELIDKQGQPARFKIVVDADKYVVLLYFYSKPLGEEHTFFLAEKNASQLERERNHYTPKDKYFIRSYDNLIEKTIVPYFKLRSDAGTNQPRRIEMEEHISFMFNEHTVATPEGTFNIKKANTHEYRLNGYKSVASMIEVQLKGRIPVLNVFLNFKQQIEIIEINGTRYFMMP